MCNKVDNGIFIHKLDSYGFRGIINVSFRCYLQHKTQITVIDQRLSNKPVVTYGVPKVLCLDLYFSSVCQ